MAAIPAVEDITRTGASRSTGLQATVTRSLTGPDIAVTGGKARTPPCGWTWPRWPNATACRA